jgi:hypothetical protein
MASTDTELRDEVRGFGKYDTAQISNDGIDLAIARAKTHLTNEADLSDTPDWYTDSALEESLFWTSMLFSKVITRELDSQAISVGAVDRGKMLSAGDEVTLWYQQYRRSKNRVLAQQEADQRPGHRRIARTNSTGPRHYPDERSI